MTADGRALMETREPFFTISDVCVILGRSRRAVYARIERGLLTPTFYRVGKYPIFSRADVLAAFEREITPLRYHNEPMIAHNSNRCRV